MNGRWLSGRSLRRWSLATLFVYVCVFALLSFGHRCGADGVVSGQQPVAAAGMGLLPAASHAASTVSVHLTAPVTLTAVLAAVVLAILGGLIAGSFGGWRAARLRPAAALSKIA